MIRKICSVNETGNPDEICDDCKVSIISNDNTLNFLGYLSDQIENIQGSFESKIVCSGTPKKPNIREGFFELKKGIVKLSRIRNPIKNVKLDVRWFNKVSGLRRFKSANCHPYASIEVPFKSKDTLSKIIESLLK